MKILRKIITLSINQLINYKGVCSKALATQGVLIFYNIQKYFQRKNFWNLDCLDINPMTLFKILCVHPSVTFK